MTKDPNHLRLPPGKSLQFRQGWRACEAGQTVVQCPYTTPCGAYRQDWLAGFGARANRGFSVTHLPRHPSGAFK